MIFLIVISTSLFFVFPSKQEPKSKSLNKELTMSVLEVSREAYAEINNSKVEDYENDLIYLIQIKNSSGTSPLLYNLKDEVEYGGRVNYFSSGIQRDLSLLQGSDTLSCSFVHWERSFTSKPILTVTAIFNSESNLEPFKLEWRDNIFTGIPQRLKLH